MHTVTDDPPSDLDPVLDRAIDTSLDSLLAALHLTPLGDDRFTAPSEHGRFSWIFGGQSLAQALVAAAATVDGKAPASLHAYFAEAGATDRDVELAVDRVRDGRSMATRRVSVRQGDRTLLAAMASFHDNPTGVEVMPPPPTVAGPDDTPRLQDWLRDPTPEQQSHLPGWVEHPPPIELRTTEPPTFLGGRGDHGTTRSHWMRVGRDVGDDPVLHAALLTYTSDYFLLDMIFRSYPEAVNQRRFTAFSLDHAIWFHRPVRFDRWHLHTQETLAITGHRGLTRGTIHDIDGHLVATVAQDVLARPVD